MQPERLTEENARELSERYIEGIPPYPGNYYGRGIVICGGGSRYFACAWVCIQMLRRLGCYLPIQLWHLGEGEMDDRMRALVSPLNVRCVDATRVRRFTPARILNGWELKPYAILNSPFQEVLLLDADNIPVANPEFLFQTAEYLATGAIFWPDFGRLGPERSIWRVCGVPYRDEPEFESGQIVIDKQTCWLPLCLAMWYNEHSDFYYHHIHGDKETFHLAFRKLAKTYSMPSFGIQALQDTMCQHDFSGRRIFQHRNLDKWNLIVPNKTIAGFWFEEECFAYLAQLRKEWNGRVYPKGWTSISQPDSADARSVAGRRFEYNRVGYDSRTLALLIDGTVGEGAAEQEMFWDFSEEAGNRVLRLWGQHGITCRLQRNGDQIWRGRWLAHERMPIELRPIEDGAVSGA
jgi:hypothetical protein